MNRKTFLATLAGFVSIPFIGKIKPIKEPIHVNYSVNKQAADSIVARCQKIRKEMELLAGQNYAFTQGRIHGSIDFIKESAINDAIAIQDVLNKKIFDELSKTD